MRTIMGLALAIMTMIGHAHAHSLHHHHRHWVRVVHHGVHHRYYSPRYDNSAVAAIPRPEPIETEDGPISVLPKLATAWKGLIHDFIESGYKAIRISCWAPVGTHVQHSLHYIGAACDFNQRGWGLTDHFMYSKRAGELIRKWGFRNGGSFSDWGHVDAPNGRATPGRFALLYYKGDDEALNRNCRSLGCVAGLGRRRHV